MHFHEYVHQRFCIAVQKKKKSKEKKIEELISNVVIEESKFMARLC